MRFFCGLLAAGLFATACATAAEPASPVEDQKDAVERPQFFVHLNCSPRDQRAVESTLKLAKTLSNDQSDVILFLDLRAVVLAVPNPDVLDKDKRDFVEGLFEKLRCSGVEMLVCPHCAGELGIQANRIRKGARFTTKEEIQAATNRADKVFEYKEPLKDSVAQPADEVLAET